MKNRVVLFAVVTLIPVPLLGIGSVVGGVWIYLALGYLTVFAFAMDEVLGLAADPAAPDREFPAANLLSVVLALVHFPLLGLAVFALSGGVGLGLAEKVAVFFAAGLFFGQVSNSNAHELIHRSRAPLYQLGKWVFISHLFGHHASAHRLVHHRYVGTADDPSSAPLGMGFYRFAFRAWVGSFKQGFRAENRVRMAGDYGGVHPYSIYVSGALVMLGVSAVIGGIGGVAAYVGLASYASMQLLLSDYVQHYGLRRGVLSDGKPAPVAARHSWNAPHRFTGWLMLSAARHSDHHAHPARAFPALDIDDDVPTLPRSLAVMGLIALMPWRWHRIMDGRVADRRDQGLL